VAAGFISKSRVNDLCRGVISDDLPAHLLPAPLADLWRDGFIEGANQTRAQLAQQIRQLEYDVNHWYVAANYSPDEIADMRRRASYLQARIDWSTGVVA